MFTFLWQNINNCIINLVFLHFENKNDQNGSRFSNSTVIHQGRRTRGGCGCFNTHTFLGERVQHPHFFRSFAQTPYSSRSPFLWPLCVCARCGCLLSPPSQTWHRLMIGCSALSPASLGVLDLSVSSCWGGENLCYGYLHLPFPGTLNECIFTTVLTYFLCVPSVFLYFSSNIHLNGKLLYLVCYTFCTLLSLYSSFLLLTKKPHPSPALLKSLLRHWFR